MSLNLSRLTKVNPREVWKHEALDFTQWLAKEENISLLCDELEINIENVKAEVSAGRYNVDLVGDEIDTKRKVIIENQLEQTDHKHLGQIITYASAHEASIIIWIVKDYTEEHRQAIDWFNRNMNSDISFFLVQIELFKIGNSDIAPSFNIISEPNNWGKTIKKLSEGDSFSGLKLQQLEFWEGLKKYAQSKNTPINFGRAPRPQHWFNISIGTSKCHIAITLNSQKEYVGCEIYIRNDDKLYHELYNQKDSIEKELGTTLEWMELPEATASRIITTYNGNPRNKEKWDEYFKWVLAMTEKFAVTFKKYI